MRHEEGPWELCLQVSPSECFSYEEEGDPLGLSTSTPLPAAGPGAEHTAGGSDPQGRLSGLTQPGCTSWCPCSSAV